MLACPEADCGWRALAPSRRAALSQLAEHLVDEHGTVVDADVPEGEVQVRRDGEWRTLPVEEAAVDEEPDAGDARRNASGGDDGERGSGDVERDGRDGDVERDGDERDRRDDADARD